jgi:hypothetical protein
MQYFASRLAECNLEQQKCVYNHSKMFYVFHFYSTLHHFLAHSTLLLTEGYSNIHSEISEMHVSSSGFSNTYFRFSYVPKYSSHIIRFYVSAGFNCLYIQIYVRFPHQDIYTCQNETQIFHQAFVLPTNVILETPQLSKHCCTKRIKS